METMTVCDFDDGGSACDRGLGHHAAAVWGGEKRSRCGDGANACLGTFDVGVLVICWTSAPLSPWVCLLLGSVSDAAVVGPAPIHLLFLCYLFHRVCVAQDCAFVRNDLSHVDHLWGRGAFDALFPVYRPNLSRIWACLLKP